MSLQCQYQICIKFWKRPVHNTHILTDICVLKGLFQNSIHKIGICMTSSFFFNGTYRVFRKELFNCYYIYIYYYYGMSNWLQCGHVACDQVFALQRKGMSNKTKQYILKHWQAKPSQVWTKYCYRQTLLKSAMAPKENPLSTPSWCKWIHTRALTSFVWLAVAQSYIVW